MRSKNFTCAMLPAVIRLSPIRNKEAGGYAVRVTRGGKTMHWVYMYPANRIEVLNAILTKIGKMDASLNSRGRRRHKRNPKANP